MFKGNLRQAAQAGKRVAFIINMSDHDFFEMIFVQSGGCINYIFDRNISMQTGDICIMASDITLL